jgi:hypothetical protein
LCVSCEEDKRWDEIYRAKFEDPEYYGIRIVLRSSPISDVKFADPDRSYDHLRGNVPIAPPASPPSEFRDSESRE